MRRRALKPLYELLSHRAPAAQALTSHRIDLEALQGCALGHSQHVSGLQSLSRRRCLHTSACLHAKRGDNKRDRTVKAKGPGAASTQEAELVGFDPAPHSALMELAVSHFQQELGKIHAGRASPGLLEPVEVHANNERRPLREYGTVTVRSPSLLAVTLYNPADLDAVANAIRKSPLKLQARVEGKEVHVPLARPSLEQVAAYKKLVAQEAENAKNSVRRARAKAMVAVAKAAGEDEDEKKRLEQLIEVLKDKYVKQVDQLKAAKSSDLDVH